MDASFEAEINKCSLAGEKKQILLVHFFFSSALEG